MTKVDTRGRLFELSNKLSVELCELTETVPEQLTVLCMTLGGVLGEISRDEPASVYAEFVETAQALVEQFADLSRAMPMSLRDDEETKH